MGGPGPYLPRDTINVGRLQPPRDPFDNESTVHSFIKLGVRCGAIIAAFSFLWAGGIAWAAVITIYSIAGGVFFFLEGPYFFFTYPEWEIYGGISLTVALAAFISLCALSNRSYIWCSVARFLWFFLIIISALRAVIIIVMLERGKNNIIWECDNGGRLYLASAAAGYQTSTSLPSQFCTIGFSTMNTAWIIALLVDLGFQIYMFFLVWRFSKRMQHYSSVETEEEEGKY